MRWLSWGTTHTTSGENTTKILKILHQVKIKLLFVRNCNLKILHKVKIKLLFVRNCSPMYSNVHQTAKFCTFENITFFAERTINWKQTFATSYNIRTIWVSFCRTGKMSVLCLVFFKSRGFVWPNLIRYFQFFNWSWSIGSSGLQTHLPQALEKKIWYFFAPLKLTHLSNFTVSLTLSCDKTFRDGLDLTCS